MITGLEAGAWCFGGLHWLGIVVAVWISPSIILDRLWWMSELWTVGGWSGWVVSTSPSQVLNGAGDFLFDFIGYGDCLITSFNCWGAYGRSVTAHRWSGKGWRCSFCRFYLLTIYSFVLADSVTAQGARHEFNASIGLIQKVLLAKQYLKWHRLHRGQNNTVSICRWKGFLICFLLFWSRSGQEVCLSCGLVLLSVAKIHFVPDI